MKDEPPLIATIEQLEPEDSSVIPAKAGTSGRAVSAGLARGPGLRRGDGHGATVGAGIHLPRQLRLALLLGQHLAVERQRLADPQRVEQMVALLVGRVGVDEDARARDC